MAIMNIMMNDEPSKGYLGHNNMCEGQSTLYNTERIGILVHIMVSQFLSYQADMA